jgi:hypothetical protein
MRINTESDPQDEKLSATVTVYEISAWQKPDPQLFVVWRRKNDNTWTFQIDCLPKYLSDVKTQTEHQDAEDAGRLRISAKTGTRDSDRK